MVLLGPMGAFEQKVTVLNIYSIDSEAGNQIKIAIMQ